MNPRHPAVSARARERCEYCGAPEQAFNFAFEVEHVVPPNQGGTDDDANWALACRSCNVHKGAAVSIRDLATGPEIRLFHPRLDLWGDHFRFDAASGKIDGLTAVGRVTVERLRFNSAAQVSARRIWSRHGLYP